MCSLVRSFRFAGATLLALGILCLATTSDLVAQTTTSSIRGRITGAAGEPIVAAEVTARDVDRNLSRATLTSETGFYHLAGLRPGEYDLSVRRIGYRTATQRVRVLVGQTLEIGFELGEAAVELEALVVEAEAHEITSPEVATNITPEQIQELPQSDRNFLNFARLVPGVRSEGPGSITSGAARDENINVFIDGVSYKNDIIQGGVVGQDASQGNPFPQDAVDGFRVITQQYKAEYQKATSAIVTATTKSGTNTWQGSAFGFFTNQNIAAQEFFSARRGDNEPKFERWQAGGSLGGPLIRDELFLFLSYEGNIQDRLQAVTLGTEVPTFLRDFEDAPGVDIPADLSTLEGTFGVPFREHLFFGKLTWQPESRHTVDLSVNIREEVNKGGFGGRATAQLREEFSNDVRTALIKHQWDVGDDLLNELSVNYLIYRFNPEPLGDGVTLQFNTWGNIGVRCCAQNLPQERIGIRDDLTWTVPDFGGIHIFKAGASADFNTYTSIKELQQNPTFIFRNQDSQFPEVAFFEIGDPRVSVNNTAIGLYAQDDWSPSERLTLNLGVRWDIETGSKNNDFVTPDSVRDALNPLVDDAFRQRYFTDGDDRDPYLGAIQPRFGLSYTVRDQGGNRTVLFGGAGLYHDRTPNEWIIPEFFRLQRRRMEFFFTSDGSPDPVTGNPAIMWQDQFLSREGLLGLVESGQAPDPEVFLLDNDLKPPKAFHGSIGVRQTVGDLLFSLNYTAVRGSDDMVFWFFHRCPNQAPTLAQCDPIDPPNFTNVLVTSQDTRNWFDAIYLRAQKRYSEASRWGAQLAYTLGWAKEEPNLQGQFGGLCCLSPTEFHETPSRGDERHRFTLNWIVDLPGDIQFSGIGDFGTGLPFDIRDPNQTRPSGQSPLFCTNESTAGNCVPGTEREGRPPRGGIFPSKNVDIRFQKRVRLPGYGFTVHAEVFNLFDWTNFTGYEGDVNRATFLEPFNTDGRTRRVQLGAEVAFGAR